METLSVPKPPRKVPNRTPIAIGWRDGKRQTPVRKIPHGGAIRRFSCVDGLFFSPFIACRNAFLAPMSVEHKLIRQHSRPLFLIKNIARYPSARKVSALRGTSREERKCANAWTPRAHSNTIIYKGKRQISNEYHDDGMQYDANRRLWVSKSWRTFATVNS